MASNNRKVSQRWPKATDERSRRAGSRSQIAGSLHGKRKLDTRKIQETLDDMFMNVFDSEIIRSVAHSCNWDLNRSIEALIMLSEGEDASGLKIASGTTRNEEMSPPAARAKETKPEFSRMKLCHGLFKTDMETPTGTSLSNIKGHSTKSKSVMMNASQGIIKVTYKGLNDPDISDDDADIVIEEEKEFESSGGEFAFANASSQSMCQFLTHLIPPNQINTNTLFGTFDKKNEESKSSMLSVRPKTSSSDVSVVSTEGSYNLPGTKKAKHWPQFERIKKQILDNIKVMVLLRGVPGSGKTSLARHIIKVTYGENYQNYVFSTDQYFVLNGKGKYVFDPKLLPEAHKWNQQRVYFEARNGTNPLLIDNTNIEAWEMKPYMQIAVEFGYNLELLEPRTSWRYNPLELERKNIHNVSRRKIEDMLLRYERNLSPGKLMTSFDLKYEPHNVPPQRAYHQNFSVSKKDCTVGNSKRKLKVRKQDEGKRDGNIKHKLLPKEIDIKPENRAAQNDESEGKTESSWEEILSKLYNTSEVSDIVKPVSYNSVNECSTSKMLESVEYDITGPDKPGPQMFNSMNYLYPRGNNLCNINLNINDDNAACLANQVLINNKDEYCEGELENEDTNDDWEDQSNDDDSLTEVETHCENVTKINNLVCTDYVLILNDGTLLPQKSFTEELDRSNCLTRNGRKWEYVLMADESKLLLHPNKCFLNSELDSMEDGNEISHKVGDLESANGTTTQNISDKITGSLIPFPDFNSEKVVADTNTASNITDNNQQLLDLTGILLNIAFAGVDDSSSLMEVPSATKNNLESDESVSLKEEIAKTTLDNMLVSEDGPIVQESFIKPCGIDSVYEKESCKEHISKLENEVKIDLHNFETQTPVNLQDNFETLSIQKESNDKMQLINESEVKENVDSNHTSGNIEVSTVADTMSSKGEENNKDTNTSNFCSIDQEGKSILMEWEEGNGWDDQELLISKPIQQKDISLPKPARSNKVPAISNPENSFENKINLALDTTISRTWNVVDEPLESWEANECKEKEVIPEAKPEYQPQREQFALEKQKGDELLQKICDMRLKCDQDAQHGDEINNSLLVSSVTTVDVIEKISETVHIVHSEKDVFKCLENRASTSYNNWNSSSRNVGVTESHTDRDHAFTNTDPADFTILNNVNLGVEVNDNNYRVIPAFGRNIIDSDVQRTVPNTRKVFPILLLDKSSMACDDCFVPEIDSMKDQMEELVRMFPNYPIDDLQDIFEKCNKDINWTIDLLLESASQGIIIPSPSTSFKVESQTDRLVDLNSSTYDEITLNNSNNTSAHYECSIGSSIPIPANPDLSSTTISDLNLKSSTVSKRNGKKDRNAPVSEVSLLIKKQLEENIFINDEHYSEHVSRIRKLRRGDVIDTTEFSQNAENTSDATLDVASELYCSSDSASGVGKDLKHVLSPYAPQWDGTGMYCQEPLEEEETVALQLDTELAEQLHKLFGTASLPFNQDVKPSLNLPLSLARQLHYYLMEAEQNSYDFMMQEDEELARKLQLQEDEAGVKVSALPSNQVPDLREIMDMEMALALYKTDQKQNSKDSEDDLATILTRNLLCEWFPTLPRDILMNVFEAHNSSFEDTLEVLIASTEEDYVRTVMSPEARAAHEKALLQKASLESEKNKETIRPYPVQDEKTTQEQALGDADYYRSEASRHYNLRNECQQKAQSTYQKGLTAAAAYYSQMASLHKERIEENNAKAASSLLLAHSLGNLSTTLDLHFLYVVEALLVLDMFLDHHVNQLLESGHRSKHLFIITGRGARSSGGRSRIKPAVIQRLEQRCLRHVEVNPGLLKVTITKNATSSARIVS